MFKSFVFKNFLNLVFFNSKRLFLVKIFIIIFFNFNYSLCSAKGIKKQKKYSELKYVYLKFGKVNMHIGPGKDYRVNYCYTIKGTPMQLIAKFDGWLFLKDFYGDSGWINKRQVIKSKSGLLKKETYLWADKKSKRKVAILGAGVVLKVIFEKDNFVEVSVFKDGKKISGWIKKESLWGI